MRKVRLSAVALVLTAVWPAADLRAESDLTASKLATAVERLFELGSEPSPKSLHAVQDYYRKLPEAVRNDSLLRYAYAVVLIRQKRLFDARPLLEQAGESRPHDLELWQAKVWLHLTLGDRTKALAELGQFERSMLESDSSEKGDAPKAAAEFCGKIFAFLAGPWHSRLHAADLEKLRDKLRGAFETEDQAAFDEAEREVLAKFDELRGKHTSLSQQAHDEARKQFAQARADLLKSQTGLDEKKQDLTDKDAKRSADAKAKLAVLDGKLKKLEQQYEAIAAQMVPLELQREALTAQLAAIAVGDAALIADPQLRNDLRINLDWGLPGQRAYNMIERMLAPIVAQLTVLAGKAAEVVDGVAELEAERQMLVFGRVQDAGKIAVKKRKLEKEQIQFDRNSKRLKAPKGANTAQSRAAAAKLTLLNTYLDFPFEREKERILSISAAE
ncbi:MAG TPA: hypothetical protein VMV10_16800 [Pirellulales bacterium]|nr:hypothetical protein [Pirellulales bacterium]